MIREALDSFVASREVFEPRPDHVGASEIGLCARRVAYSKSIHVPVEGSWGAHMRGTTIEKFFWYPALKAKYGDKLLFAGPDQKTLKKGQLSATPDGILIGVKKDCLKYLGVKDVKATCILVECKSIDPRFDLQEAKAENVFQVQQQLGLIRECTKYKPEYALITYTDASFWDEVEEFAIKFDPRVYAEAKRRAAQILACKDDPSQIKPEGWISGGRECEYCPFKSTCSAVRTNVPAGETVQDPQFVAEIEDLAKAYLKIKEEAEALEEKRREAQHNIKVRLTDKGVRKVPGVVTWSYVKGRTSLDRDRLRKDLLAKGIDLSDYETTGDPSDSLRVTL